MRHPLAPIAFVLAGCSHTPGSPSTARDQPVPVTAIASEKVVESYKVAATYNVSGQEAPEIDPSASTSVGSPTHGRLLGGVPLALHGQGFVFDPTKDPEHRFGTAELVTAIQHAAARMAARLPGLPLRIGELSRPEGGDIPGHASHRSGRDVDVLFPLLDAHGAPFPSKAIPIEPDGSGVDYQDLSEESDDVPVRLDVARTWAFVEAFLSHPLARVNRIYLAEHLRSMLLHHGRASGADETVLDLFGHVTCQPRFPHDDHMHIRVFCSPQDVVAGCEDTAPIYPWHEQYLASLGLSVRPAGPAPSRAQMTSLREAQRKAERTHGTLHADVRAFLERRAAWARKPSPGRPYCP